MKKRTILVVDDEPMILRLLETTFPASSYEVLTASSGAEALAWLERQAVSLVISDHKMPEMTGVELFQQVRQRWPACARLLLTGAAETAEIMAAINEGWVHHLIVKPWDQDQLLRTVSELGERFDLLAENQRLSALARQQNEELRQLNAELDQRVIERTKELTLKNAELEVLYAKVKRSVMETVKMFSALLSLYDENLGGHLTRVAALARDLAARVRLTEEQIEEIEIAARLHDIGLLCLPSGVAKASEHKPGKMTEPGKELFQRHSEFGQIILASHEHFTEVGKIIRAHHERYDGAGYPDQLTGEAIPIGARIIAIASQYDDIAAHAEQKNCWGDLYERQHKEAIQHLRAQRGKGFDPQLTLAFLNLLGERVLRNDSIVELELADLCAGMILAGGISTGSGLFIIGPGIQIQPSHLARLESFDHMDPITQKIYVRNTPEVMQLIAAAANPAQNGNQ